MKYSYMNIVKRIGLIVLLAIVGKRVTAQTNSSYSQIIPPSPTSVQFQRYGDYPVSYFAGLPDITIPIYTIQEGDITVPITLSYHASGTRVDDVSGFVGLGWTLNTGGMISRTINGLPDEASTFKLFPTKADAIDVTYGTNYLDMKYMEDGTYDHEYDLYSYSFLGKSGKYIIGSNGPLIFQRKDNLVFFGGANLGIRDENGLNYVFGGATEYQEYQDRWGTRTAATTWHLSGIGSTKYPGMGVGYIYQSGPTYIYTKYTAQVILDDWCADPFDYTSDMFQYSQDYGGTSPHQSGYLIKNYTNVVKEINFSSGKIIFDQDATTKMLNSISIYNKNNELVKKVDLTITPFPTSHTLGVFSNYKLASLSFKDVSNNTVENYSFNYYNETSTDAKPLAFDPTVGKDYWGFYNGYDGKSNDISSYNFLTKHNNDGPAAITLGGTAVKTSSEAATKTYVLTKITYPTGGYTTFDYESNRVNLGSTTAATGGLRIKTISNYIANAQLAKQHTYTYPLEGVAEITPDNDMYVNSIVGIMNGGPSFRRTYISENSNVDFSPQGSSVVYPQVSESDGNFSTSYSYDHDNAFTYEYLNQGSTGMYGISYFFPMYWKMMTNNYKPWNYGNLLSKTVIAPTFYQSDVNEYEEVVTDTVRDFIMTRWYSAVCPENHPCSYTPASYESTLNLSGLSPWKYADHYYYSGGKRLKKTTTHYYTTASGMNEMVTEKNFFYDNSNKPFIANRITTNNSKGELITTTLKFPYDYPTVHPYDDMAALNYISPVIEQTETNTTLSKELSRSVTNFDYFSNVAQPWPGIQFMGPKTMQRSIAGNPLVTDITVNKYDDLGNARQLTGKDGIVTTYLYGYQSKYPVAKVVGATYDEVSPYITQSTLDAPTSDTSLRSYLDGLRASLPNAQISTYTYQPLVGMTSSTDAKGQTSYFEYDSYQRLQTVRDQNGKILKTYSYNYQH